MAAHVLCAGIWAVLGSRRPKEGAPRWMIPVASLFCVAPVILQCFCCRCVTPLNDTCSVAASNEDPFMPPHSLVRSPFFPLPSRCVPAGFVTCGLSGELKQKLKMKLGFNHGNKSRFNFQTKQTLVHAAFFGWWGRNDASTAVVQPHSGFNRHTSSPEV